MHRKISIPTEFSLRAKPQKNGFKTKNSGVQLPRESKQHFSITNVMLAISVVVFFLHFLFYRHSFPPINVDEASFFSPAQSFAEKGRLASDIHRNFLPGAEKYTYWMPPLYIVLLGTFFQLFGSTVMVAKAVSLLLSCASAMLLTAFAKEKYTKLVGASLFLVCPFIIITSAFIRVEALAIFLTVLAIVAVRKQWNTGLLGVVAALGIMTHPLMLACAAGLGLVALRKGVKPLLLFAAVFAIMISPYIWYILQDAALFKEQMTLQFLRKAKASFFDLKPMYLLQSVPMVLFALFALYKGKGEKNLRLFLSVSMLLALVIVLRSNEFNYQVYLVPYVIAAFVLAAEQKRSSELFRLVAPLALFGFFAALLFFKLMKYQFRTDKDFNQLVSHIQTNPLWKGKTIFAAGGPDVSTYLMMQGADVERQIPVPQTLPANWFDRYNHVIEVRENQPAGENNFEEPGTARPWQHWKAVSFTTTDGAYTITQYLK
ncbi:MAG TPA: hypothetical protein VMR70_21595 [Flavisolibacter sp.]|nr:hypothetical protein [Flavisolibacter sp.]